MAALAAAGAILATACFGGTPPAASPAPAGGGAQVSAGSDVKATLSGDPGSGTKNVTITFGSVSAAGEVKAEAASTIPTLPAGFARTAAFDISTTATFDKATVCFENDKVTATSKLYHYRNVTWEDRTKSVNPPTICGEFTSFSPVAIVEGQAASPSPTPTTAPTATATPTEAATATPTPTAAATTAAPTSAATKTPTPTTSATKTPTPTVAATATPTPTASPTPSPTPLSVIPRPATPTTLGIAGRVTTADGTPVAGACVTIGPPGNICIYKTSRTGNAANDGYYAIDLGALEAKPGTEWEIYVIYQNYTSYTFPLQYTGKILVNNVVTHNVTAK